MAGFYDNLKAATAPLMARFKNPKGKALHRRYTATTTALGGKTKTWAQIGSFDVIVVPASANDRMLADRLQTEISHKVLALYDDASGVTPKDRIEFDGRTFSVVYPKDIAEGEMWLSILCMEGTE